MIDGAVAAALCNQDPLMYQYAKVEGTRAWREALAGFLRGQGATKLTADHICASFGNSLALASIAKTLARQAPVPVRVRLGFEAWAWGLGLRFRGFGGLGSGV